MASAARTVGKDDDIRMISIILPDRGNDRRVGTRCRRRGRDDIVYLLGARPYKKMQVRRASLLRPLTADHRELEPLSPVAWPLPLMPWATSRSISSPTYGAEVHSSRHLLRPKLLISTSPFGLDPVNAEALRDAFSSCGAKAQRALLAADMTPPSVFYRIFMF